MVEEDMKNDPDKQENQEHQSYIEVWFQKIKKYGASLSSSTMLDPFKVKSFSL